MKLAIAALFLSHNGDSYPFTRGYYFCGPPGTGKSATARNIAQFLELPFYEISLRNPSEISPANLEGVNLYHPEPNIGWLAKVLSQTLPSRYIPYSQIPIVEEKLKSLNVIKQKKELIDLHLKLGDAIFAKILPNIEDDEQSKKKPRQEDNDSLLYEEARKHYQKAFDMAQSNSPNVEDEHCMAKVLVRLGDFEKDENLKKGYYMQVLKLKGAGEVIKNRARIALKLFVSDNLPSEEMHSYKNAFLIINDFDRVLLSEDSTPLSFLLDYLDPCKKSFYSPYFDCQIDISKMFIILTGNYKIPSQTKFEALKKRLIEINFTDFQDQNKEEILKNNLDNILNIYHITQLNNDEKNQFIEPAMEQTGIRDGRSLMSSMALGYLDTGEIVPPSSEEDMISEESDSKIEIFTQTESEKNKKRKFWSLLGFS